MTDSMIKRRRQDAKARLHERAIPELKEAMRQLTLCGDIVLVNLLQNAIQDAQKVVSEINYLDKQEAL